MTARILFRTAPDLGFEPPEWTLLALCQQFPAELFHVDKGGSTREAKEICSRCEVRAECLAMAMEVEVADYGRFGTFAGLSARERTALSKSGWKPGDPMPEINMRGGEAA